MGENIDFSDAIEKLQEILSDENGQGQLQNILGMLGGNDSSDVDTSSDDNENSLSLNNLFHRNDSSDSFDMDMFLKLQRIMSLIKNNKNNPQTDFLQSLKPFLKRSRQTRLEQAVKMINAIKIIKTFKSIDEGGD